MVGGRLLQLRLDAGLTQQELADRAGISVRALQDLERGRVRRPRARSLDGLLTALGLSPQQRREVLATAVSAASLRGAESAAGVWSTSQWPGRAPVLRLQVLGPLMVRRGDEVVDAGPPRVRALLALLALQVGEVVSRDEIVDVLWDGEPPRTWANLVQGYVSTLRSLLAAASGEIRRDGSAVRPGSQVLVEVPVVTFVRHGYRLDLPPDAVDLIRFRELCRRARQAVDTGDRAHAVTTYAAALDCWSGPVLADLGSLLREHPGAVALARERAQTVIAYADLCLATGRAGEAVLELQRAARDEPLHEVVHARLATALAAVGDRASALALLEDVRRRLADELGVDPGPALEQAHRHVLTATGVGGVSSVVVDLPAARTGAARA
jgi:DNA-binding SARP family transcriptional activator/DNA-binding XRE family transcriptional regulator